jgi:ABC-2 type transport system permease protein
VTEKATTIDEPELVELTATRAARPVPRRPEAPLPGLLALSLSRGQLELKDFFRNRQAVAFTMALPIVLLLLLGSVYSGEIGDTGVDIRLYFIAGIVASGIMSTTFMSIGIDVGIEREEGTIKRLAGTPLPKTAYFAGKAITALVLSVAETVILIALAVAVYHLELPSSAGAWLTLAWVFPVGVASCTLLGIAIAGLPKDGKNASLLIQLFYLALQFTSGVFFTLNSLPGWLAGIASIFPLRWLCEELRSVFLPAKFAAYEPGHSFQQGEGAIILLAWLVGGLILAAWTFQWRKKE